MSDEDSARLAQQTRAQLRWHYRRSLGDVTEIRPDSDSDNADWVKHTASNRLELEGPSSDGNQIDN